MNVRQFGLKNVHSGTYDMYDLMDVNHVLLNPSGLGWGTDTTTMRIGQTFITTDENPVQPNPSGEIWFSNYEGYEEFIQFCQAGGLVLCYKPSEKISWRYLECSVQVDKSEIDKDTHYLICNVTFKGLSRWYESLLTSDSETQLAENTKMFTRRDAEGIYAYQYANKDYVYDINSSYYYQYSASASGTVIFENGEIPSYFRLIIFGPVVNPVYQLYKNGAPTKRGKIKDTVLATQKLVIDTHPKTMEIRKYSLSGEFLEDVYAKSDFTTERIFMVPPGQSYIVVRGDDNNYPRAIIEVRKIV